MRSWYQQYSFIFVFLGLSIVVYGDVKTSTLYSEFTTPVEHEDNNPHQFKHAVHLRTGLGRVTHFEYDATKHDKTILPHYDEGIYVVACTENSVTLNVSKDQREVSNLWQAGWKFSTTEDHFECPETNKTVYYREVISKSVIALGSDGTEMVKLTTKPAIFSDFFKSLSMRMYSSHIVHKDDFSTPPASTNNRRNLFSSREEDIGQNRVERRLKLKKFVHKAGKWVKKKIIKPVKEAAKLLVTGKADKTWNKDFALNWNYDRESGEAAKTLPIHGQTACTSCYFHADAGYKVEIHVKHYKLESVMAEVYGDVELNLAVTNPGPAVDIKKLDKVMEAELFSIKFMIGPVPIVVKLHLEVDLGYHFTVSETGATPHITARGEGHIRFGKQYTRHSGWAPINSHTLDLNFDSDGGTVKADLYLYANVVPKLVIEHIGDVAVTITPAVDVGIVASLPKATCDLQPFKDAHASCVASEGMDNQGCSLSLDVTPSINVEMNIDVDIELFKKTLYKKTFAPMSLYQKTFAIHGYPKCLISKWSKSNGRRRRTLLLHSGAAGNGGKTDRINHRMLTASAMESIRNANLTNPRIYLQQRGRNTQCPNDCSGKGFCINGTNNTFQCVCQESWTGNDCSTKLMWVIDRSNYKTGNAGITTLSNGPYPEPNICGHGTVVNINEQIALDSLKVCKGRTSDNICASRKPNETKTLDSTIGAVLKEYITMGYPCGAAMAELQCRISFPAVLDPASKRIAPISYASCIKLFTSCLGETEADLICTDTSAMGGSHAGIALANSPWQLAVLPSMFEAEHASDTYHKKCLPVLKSTACPSRVNKMVHTNTDIWNSIEEVDAFVTKSMKQLVDDGMTDKNCLAGNREQLCAIHMPICNKYGNQIKMTYDECTKMVAGCPSIPEKTYVDYGLSDPTDLAYPKSVCSDKSDFFVRNFVGEHPVACGLEEELRLTSSKNSIDGDSSGKLAEESSLPWHQNVVVVGILALVVGFVLGGICIKVVVMYRDTKGGLVKNSHVMMNGGDNNDIAATGLKIEMRKQEADKNRNTWVKSPITK